MQKIHYADAKPEAIVQDGSKLILNYDVEGCIIEETSKWRYYQVVLKMGDWEYGNVVSAIIRDRYSDDEMFAIQNNYLCDQEDEKSKSAFDEMQSWRRHAKDIARELFKDAD